MLAEGDFPRRSDPGQRRGPPKGLGTQGSRVLPSSRTRLQLGSEERLGNGLHPKFVLLSDFVPPRTAVKEETHA